MSLLFVQNSADRVDTIAGATVDNLAASTYLIWFNNTGTGNQRFFTKGAGNQKLFRNETNGTDIVANVQRGGATTNDSFRTSDGLIVTNAWAMVGQTRQTAGSPFMKGYRGSYSSPVVTNTSYTSQVDGSGADDSDAGSGFRIGNLAANNGAFSGRMAVAMVWNRVLTVGEMLGQQFQPHMTSGCVLFTHLGFAGGTGSQPDWSGNNNAGTVTSATQAAHMPMALPFEI